MSPLETHVREHQLQLRRRLDSVQRIHRAGDELEERIAELEQQAEALKLQAQGLAAAMRPSTRRWPRSTSRVAANG